MKAAAWIGDLLHVLMWMSLLFPPIAFVIRAEWAWIPLIWMMSFSLVPLFATTFSVICPDLQVVRLLPELPGSRLIWALAVLFCPLLVGPLLWWVFGKPGLWVKRSLVSGHVPRPVLTRFEPVLRPPPQRTPSGPIIELTESWEEQRTQQVRPVIRPPLQTFVEQAPPSG